MTEIGWKPEHFARRLNQFCARQGRSEHVHEKTPYKWLSGQCPRSPYPMLVAALLSEKLQRIINPADLGWPDDGTELTPANAGLALPWTAAGGLHAAQVIAEPGAMDRRMFLTVLGPALTTPALEWLIAQPANDVARLSGHALPVEVVDDLDIITASLRRMDDHLGGAHPLGLVRQQLATVAALLKERRYTESVGRRLHAVSGELLRLAGWLCFDSGRHSLAQRHWTAGLYEAHAAGDRGLGSNILGFMSCQAKDIGQPREAIMLAEAARAGYPATSPRVAAILDLRAAEAYANDGATTDSRRAIDAAFSRLGDNGPSHGDPGWAYWMGEAQAHAQAGYCYVRLEDWARARAHLRNALALQSNEFSREGALRNALLGLTYVRQQHPDLDQAVALGAQAVDTLSGQVGSARCVKHVRRLVDSLQPYRRSSGVSSFLDQATPLLRAGL